MKNYLPLLIVAASLGCSGADQEMHYNPTPQILPQNIHRIALHPIVNKTNQFGLEDKLLLDVRDAFLSDGRYPLVPESQADGVVWITITRYLNVPIQFDSTLVPKSYKLTILIDVSFVDQKKAGQALWVEKNIEGIQVYTAPTMTGGTTEEQAREAIWTSLARNVVTRVIDGFGTIMGTSRRLIEGSAPSTEPVSKPEVPVTPVNPHPY